MNVLIAADMEGIDDYGDCRPSHPTAYTFVWELEVELDGDSFRETQVYAGHDSLLRSVQRRLGSLVATPVMRSKERQWLSYSPPPSL